MANHDIERWRPGDRFVIREPTTNGVPEPRFFEVDNMEFPDPQSFTIYIPRENVDLTIIYTVTAVYEDTNKLDIPQVRQQRRRFLRTTTRSTCNHHGRRNQGGTCSKPNLGTRTNKLSRRAIRITVDHSQTHGSTILPQGTYHCSGSQEIYKTYRTPRCTQTKIQIPYQYHKLPIVSRSSHR